MVPGSFRSCTGSYFRKRSKSFTRSLQAFHDKAFMLWIISEGLTQSSVPMWSDVQHIQSLEMDRRRDQHIFCVSHRGSCGCASISRLYLSPQLADHAIWWCITHDQLRCWCVYSDFSFIIHM